MLGGRTAGIASAFAIAAAAGIAAGCGGGTATKSAPILDPVAAAATKTQNAGAARIRFAMAFKGPLGKTLRMRGVGSIDGQSAEMSFRLGSMLGGIGVPTAGMNIRHSSIKEVMVKENGDFVTYVKLGFLAGQIPGGKQWVKLDFSKLGKSAGVDFSRLLSGSQFEPTDLLAMLKSEGAKIRKLGSATLDGAATTHYRVTIDVAKMLQSKGLTSPLLSGFASQMKTATDDVWIGSNGLVRRIQTSYGVASVHLAMTMDLYDYGANVTIAAPPSSEVFDGTQLAQQGVKSSLS